MSSLGSDRRLPPLTPLSRAEFEETLWMKFLAVGHPVSEDEAEELLGHETTLRLKLTVLMLKAGWRPGLVV